MPKTYSRPRPFVAITNKGTRECLVSSTNHPPKKYITAMVGPFKTRKAQMLYQSQPGLFFKSVNQIERLTKRS